MPHARHGSGRKRNRFRSESRSWSGMCEHSGGTEARARGHRTARTRPRFAWQACASLHGNGKAASGSGVDASGLSPVFVKQSGSCREATLECGGSTPLCLWGRRPAADPALSKALPPRRAKASRARGGPTRDARNRDRFRSGDRLWFLGVECVSIPACCRRGLGRKPPEP